MKHTMNIVNYEIMGGGKQGWANSALVNKHHNACSRKS